MTIEPFDEQNVVIGAGQAEYLPLYAHKIQGDRQGTTTTRWKLTWRERIKLLFTGELWHQVLTFNLPLQPQMLMVDKPEEWLTYKGLEYDPTEPEDSAKKD